MKTIFVILAPSRSGKDSLKKILSARLEENYNIKAIGFKWSDYFKRVVEKTYDLDPYSLEDDFVRNSFIPGSNNTFLDVLVNFYHLQESMTDRCFWKRPMVKELDNLMSNGHTIISTDTRDLFEAGEIVRISKMHGYSIQPIRMQREGHIGLTSDKLCDQIFDTLYQYSDRIHHLTVPDSEDYIEHLTAHSRDITDAFQ